MLYAYTIFLQYQWYMHLDSTWHQKTYVPLKWILHIIWAGINPSTELHLLF